MQSTTTVNDQTSPSGFGNGILKMTNSSDRVEVSGNFSANSLKSHTNYLTNGVLKIGGDFSQASSAARDNFNSKDDFMLLFNGTQKQNVHFSDPGDSKAANVVFDNASSEGVHIWSKNMYVCNEINDQSSNVYGFICMDPLAYFVDNSFSGSIYVYTDVTMANDLSIGGQLYIYAGYNNGLNLNGFTINANSVCIDRGFIKINDGQLNCTGNFTIGSYGIFEMTKANDYVLVGGDMKTQSDRSHSSLLTNGVLEIKGDFTQKGCSEAFLCTGEHKTILSGKSSSSGRIYRQTINFANPVNSKFNYLVLTISESLYNIVNTNIDNICTSYTLDIRDTDGPSKPSGLTVVSRTAASVKLSWNTSKDDIGVVGYDVYRNDSKIATVSTTYFEDNNLTPETPYLYKVCAFDEIRNLSDDSDTIQISTLEDTTPPESPRSVKINRRTGTSIVLSWLPSSDDVGCTGYQVFRDNILVASTANTEYKDTGRSANTLYHYKIKAIDAAGNTSDFSSEVSGYAAVPYINSIEPTEFSTFYGDNVNLILKFRNSGNSRDNQVVFEYSDDRINWNNISVYPAGQQVLSDNELYASAD